MRSAGVFHHLGVSGFAERTVCAEESHVVIPDDVQLEFAAAFGQMVVLPAVL